MFVQLNMNWVSSCDFIIPVAFPDFFNVASLDGLLSTVLPEMLKDRRKWIQCDESGKLAEMLTHWLILALPPEEKQKLQEEFSFKK